MAFLISRSQRLFGGAWCPALPDLFPGSGRVCSCDIEAWWTKNLKKGEYFLTEEGRTLNVGNQVIIPAISDGQHHGLQYPGSPEAGSNAALGSFSQQPIGDRDNFQSEDPLTPANIEETIAATDLHSTSDALNLLSHAAHLEAHGPPGHPYDTAEAMSPLQSRRNGVESVLDGQLLYPLVAQGLLTAAQVSQLVAR
jgi:hypothetical protein